MRGRVRSREEGGEEREREGERCFGGVLGWIVRHLGFWQSYRRGTMRGVRARVPVDGERGETL